MTYQLSYSWKHQFNVMKMRSLVVVKVCFAYCIQNVHGLG
jgi:hypothetical protein